jgi:hypothetical protein
VYAGREKKKEKSSVFFQCFLYYFDLLLAHQKVSTFGEALLAYQSSWSYARVRSG